MLNDEPKRLAGISYDRTAHEAAMVEDVADRHLIQTVDAMHLKRKGIHQLLISRLRGVRLHELMADVLVRLSDFQQFQTKGYVVMTLHPLLA